MARVEEICDFFVEDLDLSGDIYERKFKDLNLGEEIKWIDLEILVKIVPMAFE